jgi:glycosyltransferase involved in cell wall biosynthesis
MTDSSVTIAIPTYNRAHLLKQALGSVLAQDYPNLHILVLDNASSDGTEEMVRGLSDPRIRYIGSPSNLGLFRNWSRAIEYGVSPYLCVLQDDDRLLPSFARLSVSALQNHPSAVLSLGGIEGIDIEGKVIALPNDTPPVGFMAGLDLLHGVVAGRSWLIHPTTTLIRTAALNQVAWVDTPHSSHSFDFNLFLRLLAYGDAVFIEAVLGQVRIHSGQESQLHHRLASGTGPLSTLAERTDAIAYLLRSARAADPAYRQWLAERLLQLSLRRSELSADLLPGLNLSWPERLEVVQSEIARLIPAGAKVIVMDENQWGNIFPDFRTVVFLEGGSPEGSTEAIEELERLCERGMEYAVIGWPTFWWLDYYGEFAEYMEASYRRIWRNSRALVFELQGKSV